MSPDPRDQRIAQLEQLNAELTRQNAELKKQNAQLQQRIAALEEKARKSSRNSSKPPSSDGPHTPRRTKRDKPKKTSGRKRGAQPGHAKAERELVPQERVDYHTDCVPKECERCAAELTQLEAEPRLHQVAELPRIRALIHQFALYAGECTDCGHISRASLPHGVPSRAFGPSVDATVALLIGVYRLSKRSVQSLMLSMFGLKISLGAVIGCQNAASEALAEPYEDAVDFAQQQPVKNADETSWRQQLRRVWLWTVVTPLVTVFMIHPRRNTNAAQELLGAAKGALGTDRHGAYRWWPLRQWQVCWAHLLRDFQAIAERTGHAGRIGKALVEEAGRLLKWHQQVRDGTMTRSTFRSEAGRLSRRIETLLMEGRDECAHARTAGTCKALLKVFPALWLFVDNEKVEPTNNSAERAVRHGVLMRKVSLGTQSALGSRFIERILTVHATLRSQRRDALTFIRDACQARLNGAAPPSLLPKPPPN